MTNDEYTLLQDVIENKGRVSSTAARAICVHFGCSSKCPLKSNKVHRVTTCTLKQAYKIAKIILNKEIEKEIDKILQ
ncbi:MAG: hypothetical protein HWN81_00425 [Candidatus Lokiarchaeota archaeon]|nr:hypothetical protein [Candidatus Lokiarchaeota archaeon]